MINKHILIRQRTMWLRTCNFEQIKTCFWYIHYHFHIYFHLMTWNKKTRHDQLTSASINSAISCKIERYTMHSYTEFIDQFGFKNVIWLRPPYLGGFQEHNKRGVFQTMSCFSSGTGVRLGHCIIFLFSWKPPRYGGPHILKTELVYSKNCEDWREHRDFMCNSW